MTRKKTILDIAKCKIEGQQISMLTAYDYPSASILDKAEIDMILVGDSMGNVIYGEADTLKVSMQDMIRHSSAVSKAATQAFVASDMPFGSYQVSPQQAVKNASKLIAHGGVQAVKLEGGVDMQETIRAITKAGIPVVAHIGLTPQSIHQLGSYRKRGNANAEAEKLKQDALAVQDAGAFCVVLECINPELAKEITAELSIACIGIGSGPNCDGQVLVFHDLLGYGDQELPSFVRPVIDLHSIITEAVLTYKKRTEDEAQ